jgi:hypothetical protein
MKTLEEQIREIVNAYIIGLGYTPAPSLNGKHGQEMLKNLLSLIKSIVPEEKLASDYISYAPQHGMMAGEWNACRQEIINKIEGGL